MPPRSLDRYDEKRDFGRTPEPPPGAAPADDGPLTFVIQKHRASRLHYDVRLEFDGTLVSWAVPKGPSLDPAEKRLAVHVEDHPLDYASFEGVIPKGEYGAGEVIVWDCGTYSPDEDGPLAFDDRAGAEARMRRGLEAGKLSVFLRGHKLKGSWAFVRTARDHNDWLLIKHKDRFVETGRDVLDEDRSVFCGLSIADIQAGTLPDRVRRLPGAALPGAMPGASAAPFPKAYLPMAASLADKPFSHADWLFEPKLDGIRALAFVRGGTATLVSRRGNEMTKQYPLLVEELARFPDREVVLDGEIVAPDEAGRPSFARLQQRMNLQNEHEIRRAEAAVPVLYYVFDLLHWDGFDLRGVALDARRSLLEAMLVPGDRVRLLDAFDTDGIAAYEAATALGIEGIVAKRRSSTYQEGRRTKHWLKVKATQSEDFVVGGYIGGEGARAATFGALLLGSYDDAGVLRYAGSAGSGFDDRTLGELRARLDTLRIDERPFADEPPRDGEPVWVRPEIVVEVRFAEYTPDGHLRAPVFVALRDDKPPLATVRSEVVASPSGGVALPPPGAATLGDVLAQLEGARDALQLDVQGHRIGLTNLGKEMWPAHGGAPPVTKRDLLRYLTQVSPYLLPHTRARPLTLTRYPNGIGGSHFYQKHYEGAIPEFASTVALYSEHNDADGRYLICDNLPTLLWLGQIADLELHTWYSRVDPAPDGYDLPREFAGSAANIDASLLNYPDFLVLDLDPYIYSGQEAKGAEPELNRAAFERTVEVARWLRELLDALALPSFVKTTGRTGLHIYVPLLRQFDYDAVRSASETIGRHLVRQHPNDVTMEWAVTKRSGKVFFDHNQNSRGKTLASIFSPRPLPGAPVSMPVAWDELGDVYPTDFTIHTVPERLATTGDLWAGILDAKHDLRALLDAG